MKNLNVDTMPAYLTLFIMALTAISLKIPIVTLFVIGSSICYMIQVYFRQCYQSWEEKNGDDDTLELADTGERVFHFLSWIFGTIAFFLISAKILPILVAFIPVMLIIVMYWFLWGPRNMTALKHVYEKLKRFFKNYNPGY